VVILTPTEQLAVLENDVCFYTGLFYFSKNTLWSQTNQQCWHNFKAEMFSVKLHFHCFMKFHVSTAYTDIDSGVIEITKPTNSLYT